MVKKQENETNKGSSSEKMKYWRKRIIITAWITYASFYLCRVNMSIAVPGIMDEYGLTKTVMGGVLSALLAMYAIGQFVNGQLGDKIGARKLVTIGILASAILNFLFPFNYGIVALMIIIWGLNGYFQSMGWAPTVKTIANWFPRERRGTMGGLIGSSYQIGNAISWALAGAGIGFLGWRFGFWIPAGIFLVMGIHWFIRIRNAPEEVGLPTIEQESRGEEECVIKKDEHLGFKHTLKCTVLNPVVYVLGLSLLFLNIVRYGFISWAPTYMFEVQGASISTAAFKAIAFPLAGSIGAFFTGWISDKYFKSKRPVVAGVMLFILAVIIYLYPLSADWVISLILLMLIGFLTFGPHVMIVGIMPMIVGTRKEASSYTGFIDGFGYIGAAITGVATGFLVDTFSWDYAFYFWLIAAVITGILLVSLWNYKPKESEYQ